LLPEGTRAEAILDTLPGNKPLIKLTYRPPNYEAPLSYLRTPITPNEQIGHQLSSATGRLCAGSDFSFGGP
jgi:hypothetical protein